MDNKTALTEARRILKTTTDRRAARLALARLVEEAKWGPRGTYFSTGPRRPAGSKWRGPSGRWFALDAHGRPTPLATDSGGGTRFSTWGDGVRFATPSDEWSAYTGPHGGKGWRNAATGEVRYQQDRPTGRAEGQPTAAAQSPTAPKAEATAKPDDAQGPKATVRVYQGAPEVVRKLFGKPLGESQLAGIANAVDGSTVHVSAHKGKLRISSELHDEDGELAVNATRTIYRPWWGLGKLTCKNEVIGIRGKHKGKGLKVFERQVRELHSAGVRAIVTNAAGSPQGGGNGYYTWPLFGYSGKMSAAQVAKLPEEFRRELKGSREVRDLFDLPGGADAWARYGGSIRDMTFDPAPGSRNMKALEAYKAERETPQYKAKSAAKRAARGAGQSFATETSQTGGAKPMTEEQRRAKEEQLDRLTDETYRLNATGGPDAADDPDYQALCRRAEALERELGVAEDIGHPDDLDP